MARSLGGTFTTAHHSGQEGIPRTQLLLHLPQTNELIPKIAMFERRYMFKRKTSFLVSMLDFGGVNGVKSFQSILVQLIKKDSVFLVHRMAAYHSPIIYHKNSDTVHNRYSNLVGVFFLPPI